MTYTGNYDPTQGSSTPRLRSEGPPVAAPSKYVGYGPQVPGLGNPALGIPSFSQATQFFNGQMAPQFAQIDLAKAQNANKIGQLRAQYIQAQNFYNQNMGLGDRKYNLDIAGIDLARQGNESDQDYTNRIINLLEVNYNRQNDVINRQMDLFNQDYTGQYGYTNTLEQLANQIFGNQIDTRQLQFGQEDRDVRGEVTARGAWGSSGGPGKVATVKGLYDKDIERFDIGHRGEVAGINEKRRSLTQQYNEGLLGFESQRGDLTYAFNRERESLWHEQDANAREMEMLDLKAQEAGLARDQLVTQLTQGLQNMGLENTININDLMNVMTSGDVQKQILAQQVLQAATQIAGPPPPPPNQAYQPGGGAYVRKGKAF